MSDSTVAAPQPAAAKELGVPVERQHASDHVFREIAAAILNRELPPDSPLPPERELSERFRVSRIVVREAIHRLKEYELVRVRQGSPTLVLDPDRATDMRLLGLEIELVPLSPERMKAFAERQVYACSALLDLAEQRSTPEEVDAIEKLVDEFLVNPVTSDPACSFDRSFWSAIGKGTKNRIYMREILWYFNLIEREPKFGETLFADPLTRAQLYKALVETLRSRSGSASRYLKSLRLFLS